MRALRLPPVIVDAAALRRRLAPWIAFLSCGTRVERDRLLSSPPTSEGDSRQKVLSRSDNDDDNTSLDGVLPLASGIIPRAMYRASQSFRRRVRASASRSTVRARAEAREAATAEPREVAPLGERARKGAR